MRFVLLCAALALSVPASAATTVVANYQGDFTPTTPATGWSYQWNPLKTTLGTAANYSPLFYNSTNSEYETAATGSLPHAGAGGYLTAASTGVKLGQTTPQATDSNSHYVILGYTFTNVQIAADGSNLLFHTYNFSIPNDQTLGPIDVEIYKNNTQLADFVFPAGTTFSDAVYGPDYNFGTVAAGDTLYIALGGTTTYAGQPIGVSYTLALTQTPEPGLIRILTLVPMLWRRRGIDRVIR